MRAVIAYVQVTAESGGAATLNVAQHRRLVGRQGMTSPTRLPKRANDVRELKGGSSRRKRRRTDHCDGAFGGLAERFFTFGGPEQVERASCLRQRPTTHMRITHR